MYNLYTLYYPQDWHEYGQLNLDLNPEEICLSRKLGGVYREFLAPRVNVTTLYYKTTHNMMDMY